MNKKELIEYCADNAHCSLSFAKSVIDAFCDAVNSSETVQLVGFGKFYHVEKPEHEARNPKTGEKCVVPFKKVLKFKASK